MTNKTKIFVIYHTPEEVIHTDIYQPIAVGPNKDSFNEVFLRDDIGENIADKNPHYNEMTAIYWVYTHIDEFKDVNNFGFVHYRRFLCFNGLDRTAYVKKNIDKNLISINQEKLNRIFVDYDFIAPRPNHYSSVRKHYQKSHNSVDVDLALEIIKEKTPEYYSDAEDYFANSDEYSYNMFVFNKEDFIKYGDFVFTVLEEFEKRKTELDRLYISERLTGIFISRMLKNNNRLLKLPVLHIRKKAFKKSVEQTNDNFKKKTDHGVFYKCKSLLLNLMPRWLEQSLRRRKAR